MWHLKIMPPKETDGRSVHGSGLAAKAMIFLTQWLAAWLRGDIFETLLVYQRKPSRELLLFFSCPKQPIRLQMGPFLSVQ